MSAQAKGIGVLFSDPDDLQTARKALARAEALFKAIYASDEGDFDDVMVLAETGTDLVIAGHEALQRFADEHRPGWAKGGKEAA